MSYDEFVSEICENIDRITGDQVKLSVCTAIKNNNCKRKGIVFSETGRNVSPTIYLEEYYEKFLEGQEIEKIAMEVADLYDQIKTDHSWKGDEIRDYENIRDHIVLKLISLEKNRQLLEQIPYVAYMDFAIVFAVLFDIDQDCGQIAMMQIKSEHLSWWNVTKEVVYERALINAQKLLPYELCTMYAAIADMLGETGQDEIIEQGKAEELYILSNRYRNCGAAAICYPGVLEMIAGKLNQGFYILPSSIHEVIIVPESEALPVAEMEKIVREVNQTYVHTEEYLSDSVYYFNKKEYRENAILRNVSDQNRTGAPASGGRCSIH